MFAKLSALVGGGYTFPYNVEDAYDVSWGNWTHHRGTAKDDGAPVSIFKISSPDPQDRRLVVARNGVKRLKLLRHPNVLAFKDSAETTEKGNTVLYLVTEPVTPLKVLLSDLDLSESRNEYLAMGMLHIAKAVSFINNDCKMIHGNICLAAVVVTDNLDWKLHGFDLLSEMTLTGDFALTNASWMVGTQYKPAELAKSEWNEISESPPWGVDSWGLGCLMQEVFSGEFMSATENLRRTDYIPQALLQDYQKLLSSNPSRRLNPAKVAESKFLNNKLVEAVNFMENIAVRDAVEKDTFFKRLPILLPAVPASVAVRKILPLLSSALEFGGAPATAVSSLLMIGKNMDSEEFLRRVVPTLTRLFASTDRNLRRNLLESIDQYGPHLTQTVVEEQIFPHLATGFSDTNAYIRELTLKSMLTLAPKLSNRTMTQTVLKHLSKLQVDEEPSIRANTTVLLGNVAPHLGDATCKRVLLNAFSRALKDGFPPARVAGLRAMIATSKYYSVEEAATRILPSVAPLSIDGVADVRHAALQCVALFLNALRENDAKVTASSEAAALQDGTTASSLSGTTAGAAGSMLGWAVSSLMSSVGSGATAPAKAASSPQASPALAAPAAVPPAATASAAASTVAGRPAQPSSAAPSRPMAKSPSQSNGWEDLDDAAEGWDDMEASVEDEAEVAARSRLAGGSRGVSANRTGSTGSSASAVPRVPSSSDGWETGDSGGWEDSGSSRAGSGAMRSSGSSTPPGSTTPSAAARPRTMTRPSSGSRLAGGEGATARKGGAMKLGAQKLGASKLASE